MKHDQWSVDWRNWDETWTMKCALKEIRGTTNNEIDNVTSTTKESETPSRRYSTTTQSHKH